MLVAWTLGPITFGAPAALWGAAAENPPPALQSRQGIHRLGGARTRCSLSRGYDRMPLPLERKSRTPWLTKGGIAAAKKHHVA